MLKHLWGISGSKKGRNLVEFRVEKGPLLLITQLHFGILRLMYTKVLREKNGVIFVIVSKKK